MRACSTWSLKVISIKKRSHSTKLTTSTEVGKLWQSSEKITDTKTAGAESKATLRKSKSKNKSDEENSAFQEAENKVKEGFQSLRIRIKRLRSRDKLRDEKSTVQGLQQKKTEEPKSLQEELKGYQEDLKRYHEELKQRYPLAESAGNVEAVTQELAEAKAEIKALSEEVARLKFDQDVMQPLLDVGAAVRLRFLEQTKKTISGGLPMTVNAHVIESGNEAAHWATASADLALAHGGYLEGNTSMDGVLTDLYQTSHPQWNEWPPMVKEAIDCRATIATIQTTSNGMINSAKWKEVMDLLIEIEKAWNNLSAWTDRRSIFESNPQNKEKVEKLKELTLEIMEIQKENFRSGRSPSRTSPKKGERKITDIHFAQVKQ